MSSIIEVFPKSSQAVVLNIYQIALTENKLIQLFVKQMFGEKHYESNDYVFGVN
jgi:hypothetical protein